MRTDSTVRELMKLADEMDAAELYFFVRVARAVAEKRPRRAVQAAKDFGALRGRHVPPESLALIRKAATA